MKSLKTFIVFFIAIFLVGSLEAQTKNTGERLITQLKNGTAPGLQFAKTVPSDTLPPAITDNANNRESLVTQIRKGIAPGMKFFPVQASAPAVDNTTATQKANVAQAGQLASEQEIKKVVAPPGRK
jgi:hypothetical protein